MLTSSANQLLLGSCQPLDVLTDLMYKLAHEDRDLFALCKRCLEIHELFGDDQRTQLNPRNKRLTTLCTHVSPVSTVYSICDLTLLYRKAQLHYTVLN